MRTFETPGAFYGLPHDVHVSQLEEFWESEAPRIGEEGAEGWAAWVSSGHKQANPGFPAIPPATSITDLDPYRQWAAREQHADQFQTLPCRSFEGTHDPYSSTLFSDVQALLIPLRSSSAKAAFRKTWLSVLGLHIPGFSASLSEASEVNWDDRWSAGHLTKPSYLSALFPRETLKKRLPTEAAGGVIVGREKEYASGFGPLRSWGHDVLNSLDLGVRSEKLGIEKNTVVFWGVEDAEGVEIPFVRRMFSQLRLGDVDTEWDVLTLAFEALVNVKKYVSFIMKRNPA